MHTVTLNIQDNIYSNIMYLLKNLNHKDLEITEEKRISTDDTKYNNWNKIGCGNK